MPHTQERNICRPPLQLLACICLLILITAVYWPVENFEFITFDDPLYVTDNGRVQAGLTLENIGWAFTTTDASNYHPLTWLSHMLDVELFGLDAGRHHQVNLLLHLANTLLLFSLLLQFTGARWRSFMVAALFGLHPLHVESVAWISERKDVLSTLFWLLTMWFYSRYRQRTTATRYVLVFLSLGLGLLVKPMLVSLPLVLLLLDYWPLKSLDRNQQKIPFPRLVLEKVPLFGLAAASCLVTYIAQSRGDSIIQSESLGLPFRLANASIAYVTYLANTLWPRNLAVFYPHPGPAVSLTAAAASLAVLVVISWLAFRNRRENPYVFVGWFWYVVTLLPVAGLVQAGLQARADRYTYIPLIGVFVALCWMLPHLLREWRHRQPALAAVAAVVLLCFIPLARAQVNCWQNDATLYSKAIAATEGNYLAYNNLGICLVEQDRLEEAISNFRAAVRFNPNYVKAHNNLALALEKTGSVDEAISHFRKSIELEPSVASTYGDLGAALYRSGLTAEAIDNYRQALQLDPTLAWAHNSLGIALEHLQQYEQAANEFLAALDLAPGNAAFHSNLGALFERQGRFAAAVDQYTEALAINPDSAAAHNNLGGLLELTGRIDEAVSHYNETLRIDPGSAIGHYNLGHAMERLGRFSDAVVHYRQSLQTNPNDRETRWRLDNLLSTLRRG